MVLTLHIQLEVVYLYRLQTVRLNTVSSVMNVI